MVRHPNIVCSIEYINYQTITSIRNLYYVLNLTLPHLNSIQLTSTQLDKGKPLLRHSKNRMTRKWQIP